MSDESKPEETPAAAPEETKAEEEPKAEEEAAPADDEDKVKEEESTATFEPVVSSCCWEACVCVDVGVLLGH